MEIPLPTANQRVWQMSDGAMVAGRWWPGTAVNHDTAVVYLHGIQSHGGWYTWSGALLARMGLPVLMPDRRGSGLNSTARGDAPSADRLVDDLDELSEWVRFQTGASRLAVVGVSWGGKLAIAWALRRPERIRSLLLIAPGLFPAVDISLWERLRIGWHLVVNPTARHAIPLNDPALFTDNPEKRRFIARDSLKLTHASARLLFASARLDRRISQISPKTLRPNATLLLAENDRIIRNQRTQQWLQKACVHRPTVQILSGAGHTLEFERDRTRFQQAVEGWARELSEPDGPPA